jgi:hypothetical protein
MAAATSRRLALLLVILAQVMSILVVAARPLRPVDGAGGWLENAGIETVMQILDSGPSGGTHCC